MQAPVPVKKIMESFGLSKSAFYKNAAKHKIQFVKVGGVSCLDEQNFALFSEKTGKKPSLVVEAPQEQKKQPAEPQADEVATLRKQTETLQYQIKEYAERFIDMKQRAEELKVDKEQFAGKRDESRKENKTLMKKNAQLSVFVAILGVLLLVAVCLFFWSR